MGRVWVWWGGDFFYGGVLSYQILSLATLMLRQIGNVKLKIRLGFKTAKGS